MIGLARGWPRCIHNMKESECVRSFYRCFFLCLSQIPISIFEMYIIGYRASLTYSYKHNSQSNITDFIRHLSYAHIYIDCGYTYYSEVKHRPIISERVYWTKCSMNPLTTKFCHHNPFFHNSLPLHWQLVTYTTRSIAGSVVWIVVSCIFHFRPFITVLAQYLEHKLSSPVFFYYWFP